MIWNYIDDLRQMAKRVKVASFDDIVKEYDTIIFEGAQGLALDEDNLSEIPHTTASNTTSDIPRSRVNHLDCDIEIVYVTRTYFTRHGAGKFPTECDKSEINPNIIDLTNEPNDYQGILRYGKFDIDDFLDRVCGDGCITPKLSHKIKNSAVFITHLNETNNDICGNTTIEELWGSFDKTYVADGKFTRNVKVLED
jgi:adenylosuccinate synthase